MITSITSTDFETATEPPRSTSIVDAVDTRPSRRRASRVGDSDTSDADLIAIARRGGLDGFAQLYRRHVEAATRFARSLSRCAADADDLVSEAFTRMLDLFRSGRGPEDHFRPYLMRTIRNISTDGYRREQRVEVSDDVDQLDDADPGTTVADRFETEAAVRALDSLPPQWRSVLWRMEVLDLRPRQLAAETGQSAHNLSALAHRAREGLRNAYLAECNGHSGHGCETYVARLGAFVRNDLGRREQRRIEEHLVGCDRCLESVEAIVAHAADLRLARVSAGRAS